MSEDWSEIAEEVAEELGEVGMVCTLVRETTTKTKPWGDGDDDSGLFELSAVQTQRNVTDKFGTQIGEVNTVLLVSAISTAPLKSDKIAIDTAVADVTESTVLRSIESVDTLSPANVAVMYEITLRD